MRLQKLLKDGATHWVAKITFRHQDGQCAGPAKYVAAQDTLN
jgi:hypothetical protein